jgi:hypothetical protein
MWHSKLTNAMKLSNSRDSDSHQLLKSTPTLHLTKVHYPAHKRTSLVPILSLMNPIPNHSHILPHRSILILCSHLYPRYSQCFLFYGFWYLKDTCSFETHGRNKFDSLNPPFGQKEITAMKGLSPSFDSEHHVCLIPSIHLQTRFFVT